MVLLTSMYAQVQPVTSSLVVLPPYSTVYADYLSPIGNKLLATVTLNDFTEPSLDVRMHLTIEGEGITLETKENFFPNEIITLTPGVATTVQGGSWAEYFNLNNIDFSGITKQDFANGGRFPEGFYTFTLEVREYYTCLLYTSPSPRDA